MNNGNGNLNWIANFIWGIADDVLRDVYVRGKYRDYASLLLHFPPQLGSRGGGGRSWGRGGFRWAGVGRGISIGGHLPVLIRGRDHSTQSLHSNSACETMETFSRKIEQCTANEVMQSVQLG